MFHSCAPWDKYTLGPGRMRSLLVDRRHHILHHPEIQVNKSVGETHLEFFIWTSRRSKLQILGLRGRVLLRSCTSGLARGGVSRTLQLVHYVSKSAMYVSLNSVKHIGFYIPYDKSIGFVFATLPPLPRRPPLKKPAYVWEVTISNM